MSQFHRFDDSIHDQRGAETCSEPQKEHLATLVATQSLQGSVVHHLDGPFEGSLEIETSPAFSQIPGIGNRTVVRNQTWITHGNGVVIPIGRELPNRGHHFFRCQRWAGDSLPLHAFAGQERLDVSPTDVDHQHVSDELSVIASAEGYVGFRSSAHIGNFGRESQRPRLTIGVNFFHPHWITKASSFRSRSKLPRNRSKRETSWTACAAARFCIRPQSQSDELPKARSADRRVREFRGLGSRGLSGPALTAYRKCGGGSLEDPRQAPFRQARRDRPHASSGHGLAARVHSARNSGITRKG